MKVSRFLRNSVKLADIRAYQIARQAGLHPTTLSRLINNIEPIKEKDPRVIAVGKVLVIPATECFDDPGNGNGTRREINNGPNH